MSVGKALIVVELTFAATDRRATEATAGLQRALGMFTAWPSAPLRFPRRPRSVAAFYGPRSIVCGLL